MTQTRKKFIATLLAGTTLVAASSACAGPVTVHNGYFYVDGDDDDDRYEYKWERGREYSKGKKAKQDKDRGKRERHPHEYRYEYRPIQPVPQASTPRSPVRSFPRESATEHANAKARQRDILERELAAEQQLLAEAKARADAENARHHERNIEGLKRELRNLGP